MHKTTNEIRQDFLNFFKEKKHFIMPSSSLVPSYHDPTLLFTNAGMNQFKNIFLNLEAINHPRVATIQRCLRTGGKHNDLDNVGYTDRHHTFFEMLGNFSFGDYFKKEAILYAWELLTSKKWFNLPKNKLWVSVYKDDYESYKIWEHIVQIPKHHIIRIGDKNHVSYDSENFWQMGDSGPCGPCTEIFYNQTNYTINSSLEFLQNKNKYFLEIWNIVFIEFNRISKGTLVPLTCKSIDTGMGLERIASILQNVSSNYEIDIFKKLINIISQNSDIKKLNNISLKIIADHIRSCVYMIADDVIPSNEHRGYVLRRIIRRALRHGYEIGMKKNFFHQLVFHVIDVMGISSKILKEKRKNIEIILQKEEMQFSKTLTEGLKILNQEIKQTKNQVLSGKTAFYLHDTLGFPIDLTSNVCREKNIKIDHTEYQICRDQQKKQSNIKNKFYKNYNNIVIDDVCVFKGYDNFQSKSLVTHIIIQNKFVQNIKENEKGIIFLDQTPFYTESGGQICDIGILQNTISSFKVEEVKKYGNAIGHVGTVVFGAIKVHDDIYAEINRSYRNKIEINHSATHLLHSGLKKVLGNHVNQRGSLVTNTHLRFDFSYEENIKISQIQEIEKIVNIQIQKNSLINIKEMNFQEALKYNPIALFQNQYHTFVRIVFINKFSIELCGGTHTQRTGNIGLFKIISYSNIASGVKRIEAFTGESAIKYLHKQDNNINNVSYILNVNPFDIENKIKKLITKIDLLEHKSDQLQKKENAYYVKKMIQTTSNIEGVNFIKKIFYQHDHKSLKNILDQLKIKLNTAIIIFINIINNNFKIIIGVTKNLINSITALNILQMLKKKIIIKGGGNKEIASGEGLKNDTLPWILQDLQLLLMKQLKK